MCHPRIHSCAGVRYTISLRQKTMTPRDAICNIGTPIEELRAHVLRIKHAALLNRNKYHLAPVLRSLRKWMRKLPDTLPVFETKEQAEAPVIDAVRVF
jgi:hypothetical protein